MLESEDLGRAITIFRLIGGWSQGELAEAAGLKQGTISEYEKGKTDPQSQTLRKLLLALGVSYSILDQTLAFIQWLREQMEESKGRTSLEELESAWLGEQGIRTEIVRVSADGGRFASRLLRLILEILTFKLAGQPPGESQGGGASENLSGT